MFMKQVYLSLEAGRQLRQGAIRQNERLWRTISTGFSVPTAMEGTDHFFFFLPGFSGGCMGGAARRSACRDVRFSIRGGFLRDIGKRAVLPYEMAHQGDSRGIAFARQDETQAQLLTRARRCSEEVRGEGGVGEAKEFHAVGFVHHENPAACHHPGYELGAHGEEVLTWDQDGRGEGVD